MPWARLAVLGLSVSALSACHRPAPPPPAPEPTPAAVEVKPLLPPTPDEQEMMSALSSQGASALAGLGSQADVAHGATWFQGSVPAQGSTAYFLLGKLGEAGASTLRFVLRHQGQRAANFVGCTVSVDGNEVGSFSPAPNKFEKLPDGSVLQVADIQFEDVRPIVLTMINGPSAVIRTGDSQEIRLGRSELEDMRRVLSAYLHLQAKAGN